MDGGASSMGYALAFKALCQLTDIECVVVRGRVDGLDHFWNIVKLGDSYYHIDAAMDDGAGAATFFLKGDTAMQTTHKWAASSYPACGSDYVPQTEKKD